MRTSTYLTAAALAASPAIADVTGNNPLSIFQFGDTNHCRDLFYNNGACGLSTYFPDTPSDLPLVAIPGSVFDQYGQAQDNSLCGKVITLTRESDGTTGQAIVADENLGGENSIDTCLVTWEQFGGHDGDGSLIEGISWVIAE